MTDIKNEQVVDYLLLKLHTLLPNTEDLELALAEEELGSLKLLFAVHQVSVETVALHIIYRLHETSDAELRRAYFWLKQFNQHQARDYFVLQHPESGESTMPQALYRSYWDNVKRREVSERFGRQDSINLPSREAEYLLEPLFQTFTVLLRGDISPWWEKSYSLNRDSIDELVDYLRRAIS
jgi:hypothetical protein